MLGLSHPVLATQAGASPNAKSADGETALHLACIWGQPEAIRLLLAAGAKPNMRATAEKSLEMTPLTVRPLHCPLPRR
jgi:ankyrin repeat protein